MPFRNPITSLPASKITDGTFTGTYVNAGQFTLAGDPAHSHVQASPTSLVFYAADGVTPLIAMDTTTGAGTIQTAGAGTRTVMDSSGLHWYSGVATESAPGGIDATPDGANPTTPKVALSSSKVTGKTPSTIALYGDNPAGAGRVIIIDTDQLMLNGNVVEVGATNGIQSNFFSAQVNGGVQDYLGHPHPRWATGTQRTLDGGGKSGTTDGSGQLTVNHSLGVVPTCVDVSLSGTGVATLQVVATSSTTFTVRALNASGVPLATTAIAFFYIAIG